MKKFALLLSVIFSVLLVPSVFATDYTVDRTSNSTSDGSGTTGSLPYCISQALGDNAGPHTITFNIPASSAGGDGKYVINLDGHLNLWTHRSITIDATTQPEYECEPLVVLRGNGTGRAVNAGSGGTFHFKGLIFQNWESGIEFYQANGGSVKNCWIGLNNTGTDAYDSPIKGPGILATQSPVTIGGPGCERNVVANCLAYDNAPAGAVGAIQLNELNANGASVSIENNYIGTDKTGTVNIGNGGGFPLRETGIVVTKTQGITIKDNVVTGSAGNGIWISEASNSVIVGNKLGVDFTGMEPMGNGGAGLRVDNSEGVVIGGATVEERNIISANGGAPDSRNCGNMQRNPNLTDASGETCGKEPCKSDCPDKYDATLQCGIYFKGVNNSFIRGNYIGTDATGNSTGDNNSFGNLYAGIKFEDNSNNNVIGGPDASYRNIVGGNGFDEDPGRLALGYEYKGHGIQLNKASVVSTEIRNNYVGVGADGSSPIGNRQDGISILGSQDNIIADNVIADNAFGIFFQSDFASGVTSGQPSSNTVVGNLIGTDASGTVALGNGTRNYSYVVDDDGAGIGMQHGTNSNIIGGTTPEERNVISGNKYGVIIRYSEGSSQRAPYNNTFSGNYIGVDINGTAALPNVVDGILISESASENIVGGAEAGAGNVIAGNIENGINIANGDENQILNNYIGLTEAGNELGNGGDGIRISSDEGPATDSGSTANIIGGPLAGQGNTIAYNSGNGINILDAESNENSITRNSVFCNELRGIELNGAGNDSFGPPVIQDRSTATTIYGTAPANSYIELFGTGDCNPTCTYGTPKLQGKTYIGFAIADANGDWTYEGTGLDYATITATASEITAEPTVATAYNTSEFSTCIDFCVPPGTVTIDASGPTEICAGETIPTLTAVATSDGETPYTFQWHKVSGTDTTLIDGETSETFTPTESGVYVVEVFAAMQLCSTLPEVGTEIIIHENPTITLSSAAPAICIGDSTELSVAITPEDATYDFSWTTDNSQAAPENVGVSYVAPTATTKYYLTVTDSATSCVSTEDSVEVVVNPLPDPAVTVFGDTEFCHDGNEVVLKAVQDADYSYQWNDGENNVAAPEGTRDSLVVTSSGSYTVIVTNTVTGCVDSTSAPTDVTVYTNPVVTLTPSQDPICNGETAELDVEVTEGLAPFTYNWTATPGPVPSGDDPEVSPEDSTDYTVSVIDANSCPSNEASASIAVNPLPDTTTTFDGELEFCDGDSVTLNAVEGYAAYQWQKDGVDIDGATSASYVAKESGEYTVDITTGETCSLVGGSKTVIVNPNPELVLSPDSDSTACIGSVVPVNATGTGEFAWYVDDVLVPDSTGSEFTADQNAEYKVVLINPVTTCSTKDSVNISISTEKIAFADAESDDFCEGDSVLISADPADGTLYEWFVNDSKIADASTNEFYVKEPGDYRVYIETAENCKDTSAVVSIEMNENPTTDAYASASEICMDDSVSVSAIPSGGLAPYTYSWSVDSKTDSTFTHSPSVTTTYSLVVTDANDCQSAEADTTVIVHERPTADPVAVDADGICFGDSTALNAQASGGNGDYAYAWIPIASLDDATAESPIAKPTTETTYELLVTDENNCMSDTGSVTVAVHTNPSVTVAATDSICEDASTLLDATIVNGSSDNITINWTGNGLSASDEEDPEATPTYADTTLTYSVVISDDNECSSDTASVDITVSPNPETPSVAADASTALCEGDTVNILVENPVAGMNYLWIIQPANDTVTSMPPHIFEAGATGDYKVIAQNSTTECVSGASDDVNVKVNERPEQYSLAVDPSDTICEGESVTLRTSYPENASAVVQWFEVGGSSPIATSRTYTTGDAGVYTAIVRLEYTGVSCPGDTSGLGSIRVHVNPNPVVEAQSNTGDKAICPKEEVKLGSIVTGRWPGEEDTYPDHEEFYFTWELKDTTNQYEDTISVLSNNNIYNLTVTDTLTGCFTTVTDTLDVVYISANIGDTLADVCLNGATALNFIDSTNSKEFGGGDHSVTWTIGNEYTSHKFLYRDGDPATEDTVAIEVLGERVGQEWFYIEVEENNIHCKATDSVLIRVHSLPTVKLTSNKDTVCVGTEIDLFAHADDGTPFEDSTKTPYLYSWGQYSAGEIDPSVYADMDVMTGDSMARAYPTTSPRMIYGVTVTDSMGCMAKDTLLVHPLPKQELKIPNLITPNDDGKNDVLHIEDAITRTDLFPGARIEVYNRWGQAVYKTNNYQNNWGAEGLADGVYFYHMNAGCGNEEYKGYLHVVSNEHNRPE